MTGTITLLEKHPAIITPPHANICFSLKKESTITLLYYTITIMRLAVYVTLYSVRQLCTVEVHNVHRLSPSLCTPNLFHLSTILSVGKMSILLVFNTFLRMSYNYRPD